MTTFDFLFSDVMAQRLGWVLVHFVWQGAAIAILLASLLAFMKNASSSAKYTVACGGLLLMACAPVVTMMLVEVETAYVFEAAPMVESTYEPMEFADTTAPEPIVYEQIAEPLVIDLPAVPLKDRLIAQLEGSLGYIVMAWALGVFALSLWHLGGWTQVTRLRKRMVKPVEGKLKAKMLQLASAIGVDRGVELLESALVAVPTVVGWLRPVILLPASAITGLSTQQLEAILAHELAHIKRCDWLVNVFQVVIETLGFYHPAVWWVSNRIRAERENCCDDVAVSVTGDRLQYARALTEMEELRHNGVFAIAATGSSLFDRIRRLLGKDSTQAGLNGWAVGAMLAMVIIAIAMPVAFAMSSGTASDTEADIESEVLEGIAANRDKFECGILAWNRKYTNTAYDGPRGNRSGQYELWWDGKKMATKYVHDQVHVSPEGNWSVERRQGGKSYDGGLLSKKPKFRPDENWLLLSGWRGEGSQDWWILRLSSMENITTSWSVVDTNGVKLIKLEPRFINDSEMEKNGNYSIFYYDPSKGYRLVKQEGYRPDGSLHTVRTVKLREVIPDGWFPVEIDSKSFAREDMQVRIRTHSELDVERCSFNERAALPDRIFKLSEDKQFKYQQKLQEYLAMQLNGSNIKEAAMDDEVKLGAREAVEMFIAAAMAGDFETGRQFADPDKAPYNQIEDIPEMAKDQHLWIMAVLANGSSAIAVSSVIQGDHERVGPLVFTLDRVSKDGQDNWWINDIDLESPDRAEVELKRFMEDHPKAQMVSYQNKPTDADGSGEIRFGEKIGVEVEANSDVSAADLVRSVRASENWVHHVDSLYLRLDRKYAGLSDEAFTEAMKQYDAATGQQMKVPGMGMPGMIANLPNKEGSTNLVEIAIDTDRLRSFTQGNGSTDLRIWDGKQMSSHYKRDEFDSNLYVLKDNPQRSFKYMMLHMEWFRSQPHVFWWNGENEVWPMSYFGNADEFEIVGQENYRGIDCYVLVGDLATSGLSWKWYVGKNDKLLYGKIRLRHGKPDVESWMLDYKEVAPGCLIPMTQGRQSYKWNEAGTSYYISGPYDLKVAQVRVNEKLDDSLFEMEFVEGVNVQDKRGGVFIEYPYDADVVDMELEKRSRAASVLRLERLSKGLYDYLVDNNDNFPPMLDELVKMEYVSQWYIESSPKPKGFVGPDYIYITGQAGTSHPQNIIVYENPEYLQKNSDKINVLYCDGHVEAVTADKFIKQLRATYKRLGRDLPEVDNLRWADTADEAKAAHVKQERMLSFSRLKKLGLAAILFAEDNDRKLPDKVDDMEPYLATEEIIEWISENVEYVGAGKTSIDDRPGEVVIAYDRSMFEANGYGTMVVYVNGRVEFIGNKRLGQLGIFGNGGEIRFGERIGIMLNSDDGLVACKSVEFKREGEFVTAVVGMDVVSRPRGGWDVVLQLLDAQGNEVRSVAERFENSRKTSGAIFVGPQEITFTLGKFSEIEKAVRFKLSIIAADWVKIETRFYLWPADDETVDTFLRTEIFVDEDGQELSEDQIGSGQFSADLSDDNVRQFKELIAELPDGKWLANPKVTVLDTEPARISVTKQRNYISGFGDSKDDSVDPEPIIETLEEGIRMELIPHIAPDGKSIRLDVDLKMTDVGKWVEQSYKNKYPYELPIINSTSIGTLVMIADQKWCLFDLGEMTSDKTADNSGKKSNRVVVFIKATKINLSNDEDFPRAKDTKNSAGKQSSVAVKIPDEKDETSSHDYGDLNKKVSPSDLFAIYRVLGHENTTSWDPSGDHPWGEDYRQANGYGPRRIIFSRKEKDMFDASSPDKYPLDGLILEDAPLITVDDIVSYDWPDHVIHLKPGVIEALPEICRKPLLNGTPFVIVANGQRISLGTFWTNISSFAPNMLTIYLDGLLLNNDLPENAIQIGRSVIVKEGQLPPPDPRLDQRIRNALDSIGKLKEDLPLGVGADGFGGR